MSEAAKQMGFSPIEIDGLEDVFEVHEASTIRAKLRTGELQGVKVPGKHGFEWRVFPEECQKPISTVADERQHTASQDSLIDTVNDLNHKLQAANDKLQAAAFRNGYLESQLEASKETIKLLEDRSRVPWHRRFWGWFTGTSGT